MRRHPAILIWPTVQAVGGLLVAAIVSATLLHGNKVLLWVIWLGWLFLLLRMVWYAANWAVDYFVVTSERMLLTEGLLNQKVNMMPLTKVTDMSFRLHFLQGRLLGYGEFIVESAGQDQAFRTVEYIPYPEQLYLLVCGMLFPNSADDDDDDDAGHDAHRPVPDEL